MENTKQVTQNLPWSGTMKKVKLTVPWGQCDLIIKKIEYKHSLLQCSFPLNYISQHRFVLKYQQ